MGFVFIEITLRHGCCPVNLLFRIHFLKNTSGRLLLPLQCRYTRVLFDMYLWLHKVLVSKNEGILS